MTALSAYSANRMPVLAVAPATSGSVVEARDASSPTPQSRTGFDPAPSTTGAAAGGGQIADALQSGVAKIAAWAQKGMTGIQEAIQGDMQANDGQVDPAKMQQYTMQMSSYEMMNQMAAKIQEKEDAAIRVWLR